MPRADVKGVRTLDQAFPARGARFNPVPDTRAPRKGTQGGTPAISLSFPWYAICQTRPRFPAVDSALDGDNVSCSSRTSDHIRSDFFSCARFPRRPLPGLLRVG